MARKAFQSGNGNTADLGTLPIEPNFIDSLSLRETIESIAVAVILAMIFKTLEAEAYVIPTGSMAPTLMGQHVEIECEECHYWFQTGTTYEGPSRPAQADNLPHRGIVSGVRCPMCHHDQSLTRSVLQRQLGFRESEYNPNQESFSGDRIVVSKVEYAFREPTRWDVIVFKYPGNAKQNYIKRLVGLPNETLAVNNGDIFIRNAATDDLPNDDPDLRAKLIVSKPAGKLAAIMIPVEDTHYFSPMMRAAGLPPAWVPWSGTIPVDAIENMNDQWSNLCVKQNLWKVNLEADAPATFEIADAKATGEQFHWLRFRNLLPNKFDWDAAEQNEQLSDALLNSPGSVVTDYYCYSDSNEHTNGTAVDDSLRLGNNWVGDLILQADLAVKSESGKIAFEAVEGGVHFICSVDIATGSATLQTLTIDPAVSVKFRDSNNNFSEDSIAFETPLKGAGNYNVRFANCDNRIYLWVDNAEIAIPQQGAYSRRGPLRPYCLPNDPADAQPLAVGVQNASVKINQLQVFRDLFYNDYTMGDVKKTNLPAPESRVKDFFLNPRLWSDVKFHRWFQSIGSDTQIDWDKAFTLADDQFFPMGDNSPNSSDARVWNADNFVERKMLIGKALLVYWPHTWNWPNYWPNFGRMRVIH